MSDDSMRILLTNAAERSVRYLANRDERSVAPAAEAVQRLREALDGPLPDDPSDPADVLAFIDDIGTPATIASSGGRYFGFVTGGALPATVAANWLAGAWDQNCFSFVSSPAVALFEEAALRWLKSALCLPDETEGAIVTGATMANFTALAAARHEVLRRAGWDVERHGLFGAPPIQVIVGDEAHASIDKVLALLGLGRERTIRAPADCQGRMQAGVLPEIRPPAIICIQAGNVNSGAFDPAREIIPWAQRAGAWVHVDGAFGLWALAVPSFQDIVRDFRRADSWAMDAHKWLNVPYDSGAAFVRNAAALRASMSISGAYLPPSGPRNAIEVTPDSSRRARAIEIWAALRCLGRRGLAELIERNCRQAWALAAGLRDGGVEILNTVGLNQVLAHFGDDARTRRVIEEVQDEGTCWCGGTTWKGRAAMRISVSSWATTDADIKRSVAAILSAFARTGDANHADAKPLL